jgi:hypothetical protein
MVSCSCCGIKRERVDLAFGLLHRGESLTVEIGPMMWTLRCRVKACAHGAWPVWYGSYELISRGSLVVMCRHQNLLATASGVFS